MPRLTLSRWLPLAAVLFLAGCDREEIRTYDVPKPTAPVVQDKVRLSAAVFEVDKEQWFFKFLGPIDEVGKHAEEFVALLLSVKFDPKAKDPVSWTLPKGWEQKSGGGAFRHSTIHPDPKNKSLELNVSKLDRISPLLANVNRWCGLDLGRKPLRESDLDAVKKEFKAGPHPFVLVTLDGPGAKKGNRPPMGDDHPPITMPRERDDKPGAASKLLRYSTPAGWKDTGARPGGGFTPPTAASFSLAGGPPEVTVSYMPGPFAPVGNVNRWRGQVGLASSNDAPSTPLRIDGHAGLYYDLPGKAKSMLVVAVERDGNTWYFKLFGDAAVVRDNRAKFEAFLKSVQFTGAAE